MKGPNGKYLFGVVKVGEKGQIVIPKEARDLFNIKPGDSLLVGADGSGIALIPECSAAFEGLFAVFGSSPEQPKK